MQTFSVDFLLLQLTAFARSRTSSFGCGVRKDAEIFSYPPDLPDAVLTPSQLVLQQAKQSSLEGKLIIVLSNSC